jgi:hypothetical protein
MFSRAVRSEMDDCADRDAGATGGRTGLADAHVIDLGAYGQVRNDRQVHAAAKAISKIGYRAAAIANRIVRGAHQELRERRDAGGIAEVNAWTEEIGVGVEGNATGRGVIAANIPNHAHKGNGVVGYGAADAVLTEAAVAAEVKVGITDGGVDGTLCARRSGNEQRAQAECQEEEQAFHQEMVLSHERFG